MTTDDKVVRHQAYRRGLCVDCQSVPHSAGRPRCELCHAQHNGGPLSRNMRRANLIRQMAGPCPTYAILAIATIVAEHVLRLEDTTPGLFDQRQWSLPAEPGPAAHV